MKIGKERQETYLRRSEKITGKYKPKIGGIKRTSGNDLSEEGPVKQGWRHYTENLYKRDDNMTTIYETKECEEEAMILEEEVRKALKALSNGKSPDSDGIQ